MKRIALSLGMLGLASLAYASTVPQVITYRVLVVRTTSGAPAPAPTVVPGEVADTTSLSKSVISLASVRAVIDAPGGFSRVTISGPNGTGSTLQAPAGGTSASIGLYLSTAGLPSGTYAYQVRVINSANTTISQRTLNVTLNP